jgi:hypothetical protein
VLVCREAVAQLFGLASAVLGPATVLVV